MRAWCPPPPAPVVTVASGSLIEVASAWLLTSVDRRAWVAAGRHVQAAPETRSNGPGGRGCSRATCLPECSAWRPQPLCSVSFGFHCRGVNNSLLEDTILHPDRRATISRTCAQRVRIALKQDVQNALGTGERQGVGNGPRESKFDQGAHAATIETEPVGTGEGV